MRATARTRLYRLGHDPHASPPRRALARALSAYERAPIRGLFDLAPFGPFDDPLVAAGHALLRVGTRDDEPSGGSAPPGSSGWPGTLLVIAAWTGAAALVVALLR